MLAKINSCLNYHPAQRGEAFSEVVHQIENRPQSWIQFIRVVAVVAFLILLTVVGFYLLGDKEQVKHLVSPAGIVFSATLAMLLALVQLDKKEARDRVEHAVDVCEKAPDLMDVEEAVFTLQEHVETIYKGLQKEKGLQPDEEDLNGAGDWEKVIRMLEFIADNDPQKLGTMYDHFAQQNTDFNASIAKAMAFFEKSAIGIELGHADDTVIWKRFNVAALKYWVKGYPYILRTWARHSQSKHLLDTKEIGFPFDYYESWLRHHCKNKDMISMLGRYHSIRMKMLKALV